MTWPAVSPDLNPIVKIWDILVRDLYANFTQFDNVLSLLEAISKAWDNLSVEQLRVLVHSMPSRLAYVLAAKGRPSKYQIQSEVNCFCCTP